jgi:hypothetical protein
MAEILSEYKGSGAKKGPLPKYDWKRLFDGKIRRLTKGIDFKCTATSFMKLARRTEKVMFDRKEIKTRMTLTVEPVRIEGRQKFECVVIRPRKPKKAKRYPKPKPEIINPWLAPSID